MPVLDLYSYRKRVAVGNTPDVFTYDELPHDLRVQIVHIWKDAIGEPNLLAWRDIHGAIAREHGLLELASGVEDHERCIRYLRGASVDATLDLIEASFVYIDRIARNFGTVEDIDYRIRVTADEAINEINERFRRAGVGTKAQRRIVDNYTRKLHRRYIKPWYAGARRGRGFFQMANGGIGELAYAAWSEDKRLASKTFKRMFKDIRSRFFKDGYINNNSFRGVRGFWYHTYGVNSALAVIGLAKAWDVGVPKVVTDRVRKSVELINVGVVNLKKFDSRKFSGYRGNASTNPKDARPHIHQMAIAIDSMARHYARVTLKHDPVYERKRRKQGLQTLPWDLIPFA